MPSDGQTTAAPCPACGALTSGKFCSECGASLGMTRCAACSADLMKGARFCHRCGLPAGVAVPASETRVRSTMSLPWVVAAIALLSLVALVAGQRFAANRQDASAAPPASEAGAEAVPQGVRAPDISQLSPNERAMRLYDRLMTYQEQGKLDSLRFFAPMAIAAYGMLGNLDTDGHYDLGRIGEITGDAKMAAAEADTILKQNPDHLLALILAAHAARLQNRAADERGFFQRLVAAEPSERKKALPEYTTHDRDITSGLEEARRVVRR